MTEEKKTTAAPIDRLQDELSNLTEQQARKILRYMNCLIALRDAPADSVAKRIDTAMRAEIEADTITDEKMDSYLNALESVINPLLHPDPEPLQAEEFAGELEPLKHVYNYLVWIMKSKGDRITTAIHAAFIAGIRSGEIQTAEEGRRYLDAISRALNLPTSEDEAVQHVVIDLQTLETILDRHFLDVLPRIETEAPELWEKMKRDIDAARDIYMVYADKIKEDLEPALKEIEGRR